MSYKIPKNNLLISIFFISILFTIVTSLQLLKINRDNKQELSAYNKRNILLNNLDDLNNKNNDIFFANHHIEIVNNKIDLVMFNAFQYEAKDKIKIEKLEAYKSILIRTKKRLELYKNRIDTQINILQNQVEAIDKAYFDYQSRTKPLSYNFIVVLFLLIFSDLYLIYFFFKKNSVLVNNSKYQIQKHSIRLLPEEYINDLETVRKRFKKQKLSSEEIETKITLLVLTMLRGYLICQIQNLWLNRNTIE